jgi:hypothetical protein
MARYAADSLRSFVAEALARAGAVREDAEVVADALVRADLRGVHSHGVVRTGIYLERLRAGSIRTGAPLSVLADWGAAVLCDAGAGFGIVAAARAMELAVERARLYGVGAVGVRNSNHCGMLAYFVLRGRGPGCGGRGPVQRRRAGGALRRPRPVPWHESPLCGDPRGRGAAGGAGHGHQRGGPRAGEGGGAAGRTHPAHLGLGTRRPAHHRPPRGAAGSLTPLRGGEGLRAGAGGGRPGGLAHRGAFGSGDHAPVRGSATRPGCGPPPAGPVAGRVLRVRDPPGEGGPAGPGGPGPAACGRL